MKKELGSEVYFLFGIATLCILVIVTNGIKGGWDKWNFIAMGFVLGLVTYAVVKTLRTPIHSNVHPNQHSPYLWDGADYTCLHGVKPDKRTLECAWPIEHDENCPAPTPAERKIKLPIHHE